MAQVVRIKRSCQKGGVIVLSVMFTVLCVMCYVLCEASSLRQLLQGLVSLPAGAQSNSEECSPSYLRAGGTRCHDPICASILHEVRKGRQTQIRDYHIRD